MISDLPPHVTQAVRLLLRAACIVRRNGHHQGDYANYTLGLHPTACPVCLLGALSIAAGGDPNPETYKYDRSDPDLYERFDQARRFVLYQLQDEGELDGEDSVIGPPEWNDEPGRSGADVIGILRRTARMVYTTQ